MNGRQGSRRGEYPLGQLPCRLLNGLNIGRRMIN